MEHLDKDEQRIMELLPIGMERPRPQKELMKITGWSSRKVRMTISRLIIIHHKPIGAVYRKPNNGYFIITSDEERQQALEPLASQIAELKKRTQIIRDIEF